MKQFDLKPYFDKTLTFFATQWQRWKPELDKLIHAITAILAVASTFKIALQMIPIAIPIITVLATLPLVGYLFTSTFLTTTYNSTLIFTVLGGISIFAGYSKYKELIQRKKLDTLTPQNKKDIKALAKKCKQYKRDIESLKTQNEILLERLDKIEATFLPSKTASNLSVMHHANDINLNEMIEMENKAFQYP